MRHLKPFLTLVRNEWRDVRVLTLVCLLLVPAALLAIDLGFLDWRGDFAGTYFVPSVVALYLAVITADIVSAEASTGRSKTYACLPVNPATRWWAKIAFVLIAGAGFTAWTTGVTLGLYTLFAPATQVDILLEHLSRVPFLWIWGGVAVIAATILWSSVLDRGFAAIGAAVVTCAVIGGLVPLVALQDLELLPEKSHLETALMVLPLVFLAASYVAFVRGPVHAGSLLRRGALALGALAASIIPVGTVWGAVLVDRLDVSPGDPDVHVAVVSVAPDGKHALVFAKKAHARAKQRAWVLGLATGEVTPLVGKGHDVMSYRPWTEDGTLHLWGDEGTDRVRREFDITTGTVVRTRSLDQIRALGHDPYSGAAWATARIHGRVTDIAFPDGRIVELEGKHHLTRLPGIVWRQDDSLIELHDVLAGTQRTVSLGVRPAGIHASPDGSYLRAWDRNHSWVVDVRSGEIVYDEDGHCGWLGGGSDDRFAMVWGRGFRQIIDLQTGEMVKTPKGFTAWSSSTCILDANTCVMSTADGVIAVHDLETGTERILYDPR